MCVVASTAPEAVAVAPILIEGACVLALVTWSLSLVVASSSLDDAAAALASGDQACGQLAQDALTAGNLDVDDVARAWTVRGKCFMLAGDKDRAERSYSVALRVTPSMSDDTLAEDAAFLLAKSARDRRQQPGRRL